jgi:hypothetical protein
VRNAVLGAECNINAKLKKKCTKAQIDYFGSYSVLRASLGVIANFPQRLCFHVQHRLTRGQAA